MPAIGVGGVYPRLRGGSAEGKAPALEGEGLSPPTRGILNLLAYYNAGNGSIPAYAGDPAAIPLTARLARVYPRLRGGSVNKAALGTPSKGLSPPTRGIRNARAVRVDPQRSIPAYAGDPVCG